MNKQEKISLQLLPEAELELRLTRLRQLMANAALDAILVNSNTNIYYLTGRVYCGFIFVPLKGRPIYAIRRPSILESPDAVKIHKIENLTALLKDNYATIGLEMSVASFATIKRFQKALGEHHQYADANPIIAQARAVKTPYELDKIRMSGIKQTHLYERIPGMYRPGMRDIDLQIEIEYNARREGCLGQFRISGSDMELFMGNILTGDNADSPSPYDFAMGGAGLDPSLPVGADGTLIKNGQSVMVDLNGNFTGYMTDMTRCFSVSPDLPERAMEAHRTSINICDRLAELGRPGAEAKMLYEEAVRIAREAGFEGEFMGHRQQAGFVGHGLGIEINELPVIAPRSKAILEAGNVIALEPKFVIPGVGAVGIENTYVVRPDGPMECLTLAPREIVCFE